MCGGLDIGFSDTLDTARVAVVVWEFARMAPRVPFFFVINPKPSCIFYVRWCRDRGIFHVV